MIEEPMDDFDARMPTIEERWIQTNEVSLEDIYWLIHKLKDYRLKLISNGF